MTEVSNDLFKKKLEKFNNKKTKISGSPAPIVVKHNDVFFRECQISGFYMSIK